ncbi:MULTISPECIES: ABC transporter permease [unclassified Enterococcus]|uniref:ABC transporter permease n=1 Tax=unclassified Enterococcus TaxID=2608891 RepID=UPI001CE17D7C|nr:MULTISPECIES: ABC transporter permease [unclassified Enterococcus]MCA5012734.1 ABC transporter permease [Enterococcus sp. S23]MCA5015985.1 ABC transporter permease [Enterococcus sp. S22(2020)]
MKSYVLWKTALKSILKNKKRSFLTMFGIIIGIASVITIVSIGNGFKRDMIDKMSMTNTNENVNNLTFNYYDVANAFTENEVFKKSDLDLIKNVKGVKKVDFYEPKQKLTERQVEIHIREKKLTKTVERVEQTTLQLLKGRQLEPKDSETLNKVVVIDEILAQKLYGDPEQALGKGFEVGSELFTIVGITANKNGTLSMENQAPLAYFPINSYDRYFKKKESQSILNLEVENVRDKERITAEVLKQLNFNGSLRNVGEYEQYNPKSDIAEMGKILDNLTLFISAVAGISLFIAGVGVMNMMYISVSERTKEIGIRRALGATEKDIRKQFLAEGLTLTLLGGLIGYLLGMLLGLLTSLFLPFAVRPDLFTISLAVGISALIGIAFSYMPASEASKKDLIDIMK